MRKMITNPSIICGSSIKERMKYIDSSITDNIHFISSLNGEDWYDIYEGSILVYAQFNRTEFNYEFISVPNDNIFILKNYKNKNDPFKYLEYLRNEIIRIYYENEYDSESNKRRDLYLYLIIDTSILASDKYSKEERVKINNMILELLDDVERETHFHYTSYVVSCDFTYSRNSDEKMIEYIPVSKELVKKSVTVIRLDKGIIGVNWMPDSNSNSVDLYKITVLYINGRKINKDKSISFYDFNVGNIDFKYTINTAIDYTEYNLCDFYKNSNETEE